jgi:hypothetical protein
MTDKNFRRAYLAGLLVFGVMLVLSLVYFRERTVLLDASYALFHMLRDQTFSIEFHRFPDAIVQALPLLAGRMGYPLLTIMKLYSVSFVLFPLGCYLLTGFLFRSYQLALVILIVSIAFVTETFFYTPSQLPQAMCFLLLLFAAIARVPERADSELFHAGRFFLAVAGMIVLAFFHPLVLFPLFYLVAFFYLRQDPVKGKEVFVAMAGGFLLIVVLKSALFHTKYERQSLSGLKNFYTRFPHYFLLYANKYFLRACLSGYLAIPVMLVSTAVVYVRNRTYLHLGLLVSGFFGYLLLTNITYPDPVTPTFYRENLYLPLAFMVGLPFVFDVLPRLRPVVAPAFVAVLSLFFCLRVWAAHPVYTARVGWIRQTAQAYADKKLVIHVRNTPVDTLKMIWGTPYEFWLLSSAEMGRVVSVFVDDRPDKQMWLAQTTKSYYVNWNLYEYSSFPHNQYFNFPDTLNGYCYLDTAGVIRH